MGMSAPAKNLLMVCEANPSQAGLGRFLSRDAVMALNRYVYAADNPVNFVDPLGLQPSSATYQNLLTLGIQISSDVANNRYSGRKGMCDFLLAILDQSQNVGDFFTLLQALMVPNSALRDEGAASWGIRESPLQTVRDRSGNIIQDNPTVDFAPTGWHKSLLDSGDLTEPQGHHLAMFMLLGYRMWRMNPTGSFGHLPSWFYERHHWNQGDYNLGKLGWGWGAHVDYWASKATAPTPGIGGSSDACKDKEGLRRDIEWLCKSIHTG
jgi:hypothetical protein